MSRQQRQQHHVETLDFGTNNRLSLVTVRLVWQQSHFQASHKRGTQDHVQGSKRRFLNLWLAAPALQDIGSLQLGFEGAQDTFEFGVGMHKFNH